MLSSKPEFLNEVIVDKRLNLSSALNRQVSRLRVSGNLGASPHNNVRDSWCQSIGPIIQQDLVVRRSSKGDLGFGRERRQPPCLGQTVLEDVFSYSAILGLGLCSPRNVTAKIRGLSFQDFKLICVFSARVSVNEQCHRHLLIDKMKPKGA